MAYATIQRGTSKGSFIVACEDGSSFSLSSAELSLFHGEEGQSLDVNEVASMREHLMEWRCRGKALDLLAAREHCRKELADKLHRKGFPPFIIEEQLDKLEAQGLVSDARFAAEYIAARQKRNPEGKELLLLRLIQKGVERETAQEAVHAWFSDEDAVCTAIQKAAEKLRRKSSDPQRITEQLRKKGFTSQHIERALEQIL